jgi:hypothetical protein
MHFPPVDLTPARLQAPVLTPAIHHNTLLYLDSLSPPTFVPFLSSTTIHLQTVASHHTTLPQS